MKKVTYTLIAVALFSMISASNGAIVSKQPTLFLSPQTTTTDIFNYLNTNLGLSAAQKPAVKTAVDEAGAEVSKLNASTTKTATEISAAKTSVVNALIKKLSSGILSSTQVTKLSTLTSKLTSMYAQLK